MTVGTDGPTCSQRFTYKCNSVQVVARTGIDQLPFFTCIVGYKYCAASADYHGRTLISNKDRGKRCIDRRYLVFPCKSPIQCSEDRSIISDRKSRQFVRSKMYRIKGITLRQRILPNPSPVTSKLRFDC